MQHERSGDLQKDTERETERDKSGRETHNSEENWTHCGNPHEKKRKGGEKVRE